MGELRDRNVLITGAASGLGRLLALKMAARGATLILWDVDAQGLERVRGEVAATGRKASAYPCNLRDRAAIASTAQATLRATATSTSSSTTRAWFPERHCSRRRTTTCSVPSRSTRSPSSGRRAPFFRR